MVGGLVIQVLDCGDRVWFDVRDTHCHRPECLGESCPHDTCAIYTERTPEALQVAVGDSLWWQSRHAMWTPARNVPVDDAPWVRQPKGGVDYDVQIPRIGASGAHHPAQRLIEGAFAAAP